MGVTHSPKADQLESVLFLNPDYIANSEGVWHTHTTVSIIWVIVCSIGVTVLINIMWQFVWRMYMDHRLTHIGHWNIWHYWKKSRIWRVVSITNYYRMQELDVGPKLLHSAGTPEHTNCTIHTHVCLWINSGASSAIIVARSTRGNTAVCATLITLLNQLPRCSSSEKCRM